MHARMQSVANLSLALVTTSHASTATVVALAQRAQQVLHDFSFQELGMWLSAISPFLHTTPQLWEVLQHVEEDAAQRILEVDFRKEHGAVRGWFTVRCFCCVCCQRRSIVDVGLVQVQVPGHGCMYELVHRRPFSLSGPFRVSWRENLEGEHARERDSMSSLSCRRCVVNVGGHLRERWQRRRGVHNRQQWQRQCHGC